MRADDKTCHFCEATNFKRTVEHYMKKSLGQKIRHEPGIVRRQLTPGGYRTWSNPKSPFVAQTVGNVCGTCNSGWMEELDSSFEDSIVQLSQGGQLQVDADERRHLLRWATKYAACHELTMQSLPYFSAETRSKIRLDEDMDDSAVLWMAMTPAYANVFDRMLTATGEKQSRTRAMVSTVAYDRIAFVLLRHDGTYVGRKLEEAMGVFASEVGMTPVWPFRYAYALDVPTTSEVEQDCIWIMSSGCQSSQLGGPDGSGPE